MKPQVSSAVADAGRSVAVEPQLQPPSTPMPLPPATMDIISGCGGDEFQSMLVAPIHSPPSTDAGDDNKRWGFNGALGLDTEGSSSPVFQAPSRSQGITPSWKVATERNTSPQKQEETKYSGTVEEPFKSTDEPAHLSPYDRAMAASSPLSPFSLPFPPSQAPPPHQASESRRRSILWSAGPRPTMKSEHRSTRVQRRSAASASPLLDTDWCNSVCGQADDASGMEYNLRLQQESGRSLEAFPPVTRLSTVTAQATTISGNAPPQRRSGPRLSPLPPTPSQAYSPLPDSTTRMATVRFSMILLLESDPTVD